VGVSGCKDYRPFSKSSDFVGQTANNPLVMSETSTPKPMGFKFTKSGLLSTLQTLREPVVDYQETRGVPRNEYLGGTA